MSAANLLAYNALLRAYNTLPDVDRGELVIDKHADPMDASIAAMSRTQAASECERIRSQRARLNHAFDKLFGVAPVPYGVCDKCEEPIQMGRLRARPEAAHCLHCAQKEERGQ